MLIRRAQVADVEGITNVHIDSWRTTYRGLVPDAMLDNLSFEGRRQQWHNALTEHADSNHLYVAVDDGQIIGFVCGGAERGIEGEYDSELSAIYLLQSHQGKGIGRQLTTQLVEKLISKDYASMLVWVLKENPARKFYEALGGQYVSEIKDVRGDVTLIEVSYGWHDLKAFLAYLKQA